ncbi:conjugal transfer protein TraD, partial [Rhizobium sp. Pop5]
FLLGGLMEMARLVPGSAEHRRLRDIGEEAFKTPSLTNVSSHLKEKVRWA